MGVWDFIKAHMSVVIHILVWLVLFAVPLLYGIENDEAMRFARRNCVMLCGLMISFYGNYLWAIDKLLFKRRYLAFVVFNLLLFVVVMYSVNCLIGGLTMRRGLRTIMLANMGECSLSSCSTISFSRCWQSARLSVLSTFQG